MSRASSASWRLTNLRAVRATLVAVLVAAVVLVDIGTAEAVQIPETLADSRPVQTGPVETSFPIDYLGVVWDAPGYQPTADSHDHGDEPHGAVRFRHDGAWGPWVPLIEDGAEAAGQWASGLIPAGDADAYQVRGVPAGAVLPQAVALNTTDGPLVTVDTRPADAAGALANCLSRAEWGADESLRFSEDGEGATEVWPPAFYPVQAMTVHHTAGSNNDPDPAATVRAIYRFHAVDRGWGDIGYHYLIDEQGFIYEGRWSGEASTRCDAGGDGSDFAHNVADELITAGHTGGYNSGNVGIALLGTFIGTDPKPAAVRALEDGLAEFAVRHGLDPQGTVNYVNPVNGNTKTVDTIPGHRDWQATECPGERLYSQLPDIRTNVANLMQPPDTPPSVTITNPTSGSTVSGAIDITADATDDNGVTKVEFFVGTTSIGVDTAAPYEVSWNSTVVGDGPHALSATATDTIGQTGSGTIDIIVDNVDDPPTVTMTSPAAGPVSGTINVAADATDDNGVTKVEFFVGTTSIGVDTAAPYEVSWNSTVVGDGPHALSATATDTIGQTGSDTIDIIVDNTPPSVTITSPVNGATISGAITVTADTTDTNGVSQVEFFVDGTSIGVDSTVPYEQLWDTTTASNVGHTVTARATDVAGNFAEDTVSVTVDNSPLLTFVDDYAASETTVFGTVSGSLTDTQADDVNVEAITEQETAGKPSRRRSQLEHTWVVPVTGGEVITFSVNAWAPTSSDGDQFTFAFSTDGTNFTNMGAVSATSDDGTYLTYVLPPSTQGDVYVRVTDTDRTQGNRDLDTVHVDHLLIRSEQNLVGPSPAAPSNLQATGGAGYVDLVWVDNATAEIGFEIDRRLQGAASWTTIAALPADTVTFADTGLVGNTTYEYRVRSYNGNGVSAYTNIVSATTSDAGTVVLDANGHKVKGLQKANLSWTGSTRVDVYRDGALIAPGIAGSTYTDNIDQKGSGSYVYQVCDIPSGACSNQATVDF